MDIFHKFSSTRSLTNQSFLSQDYKRQRAQESYKIRCYDESMQILEQKRQIEQCMSECGVDGVCGIKRPKVKNKIDLKSQINEQDRILAQLSSSSSRESGSYSVSGGRSDQLSLNIGHNGSLWDGKIIHRRWDNSIDSAAP